MKLPDHFKIPQTAWFCETALRRRKIKLFRKTAPKIEQKKNRITANPYAPLKMP